MVMVDSIARLIPRVLGNFESALGDSYMNQLLGSPCYTRPAEHMGLKVPEELQSGNHAAIKAYRRREAIRKCFTTRPELLDKADLSQDEQKFVESLKEQE
jgi:tRNA (guanine37-N1)-methyltransferase